MASLVVLEHHLWLTLTEIKDADKVPFLDAPVSPTGLFRPAVKGFVECFTEAQKSSQAMQHFLPKCSSSTAASSCPKPAKPEPRQCSCSAKCSPFPKREGPRPKIALDLAPQASFSLQPDQPRSVPGAAGNVFVANSGPVQAPKQPSAVIVGKIKHKHF